MTALHPIPWLRRRRDPREFLLPCVLTAALFIPYAGQWRSIQDRFLLSRSVPRSYGLPEWVLFDSQMGLPVGLLALLGEVAAAWVFGRKDLPRACLTVFLHLGWPGSGQFMGQLLWLPSASGLSGRFAP